MQFKRSLRRYSLLIFLLMLLLPNTLYGTVDYLSVNHVTKEYYWGDEDNRTGWIGWQPIPEGQLDTAEEELRALGYKKTYYPFKIESVVVLTIGILIVGLYFLRKNKLKLPHPFVKGRGFKGKHIIGMK